MHLFACSIYIFVVTVLSSYPFVYGISKQEYLDERTKLINADKRLRTGGNLTLDAAETKLNETLMTWKEAEIRTGHSTNGTFPPAMHFFHAKKLIEESRVFRLIQRMPKGSALHIHDSSMGNIMWLIKNATYDKHCYMCTDAKGVLLFKFFETPPSFSRTGCKWAAVTELRTKASDPDLFDQMLYLNMTLIVDDPASTYPSQSVVWARFLSLFQTSSGLIFYAPVFRDYFYESLREFYEDGVQYIEIRALLLPVYELDGTIHDTEWSLKTYADVTNQFIADHPDFIGVKVIYTSSRTSSNDTNVGAAIKASITFLQKYPENFAGYDIVGDENIGRSLISYIDELLYPSQNNFQLPYFFHAGETFWEDSATDENIFDAILLNTTRIGHGYSLTKHPLATKLAHDRQIPIEICPISNQVLMLVKDLRNHPAADLMSNGQAVVISSDDPALWGAEGLSYDFYEAMMGLGGEWADLATLKQLALNSINYSSLSTVRKQQAMLIWQKKWDAFIHDSLQLLNNRV